MSRQWFNSSAMSKNKHVSPRYLCYIVLNIVFIIISSAYLITVGTALWLGAHSAGWILAGQIILALSVLPVGVWIYQWIEEWRFVQYQKKLDLESEGLSESTHLLHTV